MTPFYSSLYPRHRTIYYHSYSGDGNYRLNDFLGMTGRIKLGGNSVYAFKHLPCERRTECRSPLGRLCP